LFSLARLPNDGPASAKKSIAEYASIGFNRTLATGRKLKMFPQLLLFVIAFVIYNSGVGTVIAVSGPYAEDTLGLELTTIGLAFLLVQFIAFFGALMFGRLARRIGPKQAVMVSLVVWTGLAVVAFFLPEGSDIGFLALASIVGFVLGGVQALSRSLYGSMIPEEAPAEFFGFYSVFSKFSAIFGPLIFAAVDIATGSARLSILFLTAFFIIGGALLSRVDVEAARASRNEWSLDEAPPPQDQEAGRASP